MRQELMNFGTIQVEVSQFSKDKKMFVENRAIYLFLYAFQNSQMFQSDEPGSISKIKS